MSAEIVQANYETLEQVGQRFGHQADSIEQMIGQVAANVDALQNGGWIGEAATQFQVEMTEDIFPATRRLQDALQQSQTTVQQIIQIIKTAEEEAAQPFSNGGGGDSGGSPAGTRTIPDVISPAPGTFDGRRAKYDIGKPVDVSDVYAQESKRKYPFN
jgi:WXG100 family type VII secretion target